MNLQLIDPSIVEEKFTDPSSHFLSFSSTTTTLTFIVDKEDKEGHRQGRRKEKQWRCCHLRVDLGIDLEHGGSIAAALGGEV